MENSFVTKSYHLPAKHALLLHGDMSGYLTDYYINLKQHQTHMPPEHDAQLKELLGCLGLHITLRAPDESIAWTVHLRGEQPYSLFATGSSSDTFLVGQPLYENIRHTDMNIFHSQVSRKKGSSSKSIIKGENNEIPKLVEAFYKQSEQLHLKVEFSKDSDEVYALVSMPEFDETWFSSTTAREAHNNLASFEHKLMKQCYFQFRCDCSPEKLMPFLATVKEDTLKELYGEDNELLVSCPRCGKKFIVPRSDVEKLRN